MTAIPIPSGPTNREIIDRAYQVLGLSDSMFGRTPEEYASAILSLGAMMLEAPFSSLGYAEQDAAGLRVEEESGIDRMWMEAVAYSLAARLAPTIGKTLSTEASAAKARLMTRLESAMATIPTMDIAAGTPLGSGNRRYFPFYVPDDTDGDDDDVPLIPVT